MLKRLILLALVVTILFGGIFGWKSYQARLGAQRAAQPMPPATVASAEVVGSQWQPSLQAVGSLVAVNGIDVTTEVAGKVGELRIESGSNIRKGDVLLILDDEVDRATLVGRKADQRLAEVKLQRAADLLPRRVVSQSEYDEAKAQFEVAEARVAEQQAVIDKKTIRAPFTGLSGIRRVNLGEYLSPGAHIVSLQALDPIHVDYSLPEREFRQLDPGQKVRVKVDAYPGETFSGKLSALDADLNEGTRSIAVRATLPNPDGRLRPGMFAEVETLHAQEREVLTVPHTAISFNTYGDFVFVIQEGDEGQLIAERRQVTTGSIIDNQVEIRDGLQAGERVVSAGLIKLRDGQPIAVDDSVSLDAEEVAQE